MPDFSRKSRPAAHQLASRDDTSADTDVPGQVDQVPYVGVFISAVLGDRCEFRVVLHLQADVGVQSLEQL